jgi:hypothetical protein
MKSLAHWGATIGLIGSTLLTTWFGSPMKALALPEADVVKVLGPIPVFTISDDKGTPLVLQGNGTDKQQVTPVFFSQDEAQKLYQRFVKEKPDESKNFKVRVLSLANTYKFAMENAKASQKLLVEYVPSLSQVESAKKILTAAGQQYQGFAPLFVARGTNGKEETFPVILINNEQHIPLFFEESQAQDFITQLKKDKPELVATVKIDVIPLDSILTAFGSANDEFIQKVVLWPTKEMWKIIEASNAQNPQAKPGTAPAQPATQPQVKPAPSTK